MTHDQDLARELGETLHRRADALHDTPLDLDGRPRPRHDDPSPPPHRRGTGGRGRGRRDRAAAVPAAQRRGRPGRRPAARRHPDRDPAGRPGAARPALGPRGTAGPDLVRRLRTASSWSRRRAPTTCQRPIRRSSPDGEGGWIAVSADHPELHGLQRRGARQRLPAVVDSSAGMTELHGRAAGRRPDGPRHLVRRDRARGPSSPTPSPAPRTSTLSSSIPATAQRRRSALHTACRASSRTDRGRSSRRPSPCTGR